VVDEQGSFYTLDGRFALGPEGMNHEAYFAAVGQDMAAVDQALAAQSQALAAARRGDEEPVEALMQKDRWERFLASDGEAAALLETLKQRAESAKVPDGYELPSENHRRSHEMADEERGPERKRLSGFFEGREDNEEAIRRLTWTLTHDPEALTMLSKLTIRRARFMTAGKYSPPTV
jgi:hypothetical protein